MKVLYISAEGERSALPIPTIAELVKHAERHGSHLVLETAIELGYQEEALVRLLDALDRIDHEHYREKKPWAVKFWSKLKSTTEDRVAKALAENAKWLEKLHGKSEGEPPPPSIDSEEELAG